MVNLFIGNTGADLPNDTVVAITLQVHDLTNLESRNGNFTNNIKLPLTNLNKQLLGYPHDVNSYSDIPYSRVEAQLQIDGITISGFLQINSATQFDSECVFYSGNSDFFDLLGDKKLNDLDLSDYDSYWNITGLTPNTFSTKNNTTGVIWAICEYGTNETYRTLTNAFTVNPKTLRPAIFVHSIMNKIAELTGYTFTGDFLADNRYLKEFVPVVTNEPKHSDTWNAVLQFEANKTANQTITALADIVTFPNIVSDPYPSFDGTYYTAQAAGKFSFELVFKYVELTVSPPSWPAFVINRLAQSGEVTELARYQTDGTDTNIFLTLLAENVDLSQGETVYVKVFLIDNINCLTGSSFKCTNATDTTVGYTNLFEINGNMPEMTLKEFVKSLVQRYNLILKTDVTAQIADFYTYDEVYNAEPLDWTDKIDVADHNIEFHPEYFSQNNQFRWSDETNNPPEYANGNIQIGDTTLKKELITIQQPFAASLDVIRFDNKNVMQIPLLEFDTFSVNSGDAPAIASPQQIVISSATPNLLNSLGFNTTLLYKLVTVKPRIGYIDNVFMTEELVYDDGTATAQNSTTEPLTHFWNNSAYNLTFTANSDGLIDNYATLTFSLNRFKKVTALFNLKATDALTFDFKRTIYIEHLGKFYVNKISAYQANKLTQVELIKI
jgi:hypothetical protein